MQQQPSPQVTTLLGVAPALQDYIDTLSVNQGLHKPRHRSSNLCNQCVYIFNQLQLCLQLDHAATPTIYTNHQDHLRLLNTLLPQTYGQLNLRLSTASIFDTQQTSPTWYYNCDSTPIHHSCTIHSIKPWHLNLSPHLSHLSSPLSIHHTHTHTHTYNSLRD